LFTPITPRMPVQILDTLEHLTVDAFAGQSHSPVVHLETTSTVRDALKTFCAEKVLSCPVADSLNKGSVHGFLDLFDLLSFLLELWEENQQAETDDFAKLGDKFLNHPVSDLTDRSDNDVFAALIGTEHAHRLVRLFGLGVHRVALLNLQGALTSIISQSDIVKYFHENLQLLGENADKPIQELGMTTLDKLLVTAEEGDSTISVFKLLASNLISAAPVVDKQGTLVGTLSVSDLKFLQDDLSPLLLTTSQYKSKLEITPCPSVVCTQDTTLGSVISTLATTNVHRVWVVDAQHKPVSVVSITNVCEFLSQFLSVEKD